MTLHSIRACDAAFDPSPGAAQALQLAGAYHAAAESLLGGAPGISGGGFGGVSDGAFDYGSGGVSGGGMAGAEGAPARFLALHAIELYLDAFLRGLGESPGRLRAHGHDLRLRAALAVDGGLALRRKTVLHLCQLTRDRAHSALRYGPARMAEPCEMNRLRGSLDEVAAKVRAALAPASGAAA